MKRWLYLLLFIVGLYSSVHVHAQIGPLPCGAVSSITTWRNDFPYSIGQVVIFDGVTYQSLTNGNINQNPCTYSGTQWSNIVSGSGSTTPTGPSGGVLSGTYPNPGLATSGTLPNGWTATTQTFGDNTTKLATDAFVQSALPSLSGYALLASPAFTGVPTAPTATVGTNTAQLATTAFVLANSGSGTVPSGTQGEPLINVSGASTYATSQVFIDASQFSGAIAEKINACVTAAIAVAGTCDARALGSTVVPGQGIAAAITTDEQITVGDSSGDPVTLLLPVSFYWVGGMTDGTSCTLAQYPNTAIIGQGTQSGSAGTFGAANTSNLGYIYCTKPITGGNAPDYYYDFGFGIFNYSNGSQYKGHATANNIGAYIQGPVYDVSLWSSVGFFDPLDTYTVYMTGLCCNTTFRNSVFNGNYGSIPVYITNSTAVSFDHSNFVHPGPGVPAFECAGGAIVSIDDAYTESSNSNTSETIYYDNGCSRLSLHNVTMKAYASGMSAPGLTVANTAGSQVLVDGLSMINGSGDFFFPATAVVNNLTSQTIQTDSVGNLPHYDSAQTGSGGTVHAASPTLTGTPLAPTATGGTNTTQIATTAFVQSTLGGYAPLNSPAFTGTPTAPTASAGTNTTQLATTGYVYSNFLNTGGNYNSQQYTNTPTYLPAVGTIWQVDGFPNGGGTFAGTWSSSSTYNRFQTVTYSGSTWIAVNGSTNVTPAAGAAGASQFWAPCTANSTGVAATQADAAFYWAWEQVQVNATGFGADSSDSLVFGNKLGGYNKNCDWVMPTNTFGYTVSLFGQGRGQTWIHQTTSTLNYMVSSPNVNSSGGQTIQGITLDANLLAGGCLTHHLRRSVLSDIACWNPQQQNTGTISSAMYLGQGADAYETQYDHLLVRGPSYGGLVPAYGTATITGGAVTGITFTGTGTNLNLPVTAGPGLVTYFTGSGAGGQPCTVMPGQPTYTLTSGAITGTTLGTGGSGCSGTVYVRVQQAGTIAYGFKLGSSDSTFNDIVTSGDFTTGCEYVDGPFALYHEHPYCGAPYQIQSAGGGTRNHFGPELDSPIEYGMYIQGSGANVYGEFDEYNEPTPYGAGAILIDAAATNFTINGGGCYGGATQGLGGYAKFTGTTAGVITTTNAPSVLPASANISGNVENCDGTSSLWGNFQPNITGINMTLGASGTLGTLTLGNATSGTLKIIPQPGVALTGTFTIPNVTDTAVVLNATQALTNKSFPAGITIGGTATAPTLGSCASNTDIATTAYVAACGGVASGLSETVASSATPTFSVSYRVSRNVLTANVTSFTLAAGSDGQEKCLDFTQGSGAYTVTPPSNVKGLFTVGVTNGLDNVQCFLYNATASAWKAETAGVINQ